MKIITTSRKFYLTLEITEEELKQLREEYQKIALEKGVVTALIEQILVTVR